jgi:hypothetical protein
MKITSTSQYVFMAWYLVKYRIRLHGVLLSYVQDVFMAWYLVKYRDNFIFTSQEVTWDIGGSETADDYAEVCGNGSDNHHLGKGDRFLST